MFTDVTNPQQLILLDILMVLKCKVFLCFFEKILFFFMQKKNPFIASFVVILIEQDIFDRIHKIVEKLDAD